MIDASVSCLSYVCLFISFWVPELFLLRSLIYFSRLIFPPSKSFSIHARCLVKNKTNSSSLLWSHMILFPHRLWPSNCYSTETQKTLNLFSKKVENFPACFFSVWAPLQRDTLPVKVVPFLWAVIFLPASVTSSCLFIFIKGGLLPQPRWQLGKVEHVGHNLYVSSCDSNACGMSRCDSW